MDIVIPSILGVILPFVIDTIRKARPELKDNQLKVLAVVVSLIIGSFLTLVNSQVIITSVGQLLTVLSANSTVILTVSQGVYALFWQDTEVHKNMVK